MSRLQLEFGDTVLWNAADSGKPGIGIIAAIRQTAEGPQYQLRNPKSGKVPDVWIPRCQLEWRKPDA